MKKSSVASKLSVVLTTSLLNVFVFGGVTAQSAAAETTVTSFSTEPVACVATGTTGHISGVVYDTSDGSEVAYSAGARVRLLDTDNGIVLACVIADATGRYAIATERRGAGVAIVVDPIDGSSRSLGSSGGSVRITSTPMVLDYSLGIAKWAGNVRMNTADGELSPTGTYVCLSQDYGVVSRCGFVLPRSSADGLRWAITDAGIGTTLSSMVQSSYGSGTTRVYGSQWLDSAPDLLSINLVSYIEYIIPGNGCEVGEEPNITGQVTNNGEGYATRVVLGQGGQPYSSTTEPKIEFYSDGTWTNSAADGTFGFCQEAASWSTTLQVQANVADFARDTSLGATESQWISSACLLSGAGCDLGSFAMAEKMLWGRVTADLDRNTATAGSAVANAQFYIYEDYVDESTWTAQVITDSTGRWALADVPTTGSFTVNTYTSNSCQAQLSCTIENDDNAYLLPKYSRELVLTANSQEFNTELSVGNFATQMLDPEWFSLSSRVEAPVYVYVDSTYCLTAANRNDETWDTTCRIELNMRGYTSGSVLNVGFLPQGKYIIVGAATSYADSFAKVSVNSNLQVTIDEGSMRKSESGVFELAASNGNLRFRLMRPDTNSRVTGIRYNTSSTTSTSIDQYIRPDANGDLVWNVTKSGVYHLRASGLNENASNRGVVSKDFYFKIELSDSGDATIMKQCTSASENAVCDESPPSIVDSQYQLTMELANFKVSVCALPNDEPCGSGYRDYVYASLYKTSTTGDFDEVELSGSNGVFYGKIKKAASALDIYELKIDVPYDDDNLWAPIVKYVSINTSGVIKSCASQGCTSSSSLSFNESSGTYDLGELRYSVGNVVGRVLLPGDSTETVADTYVRAVSTGGGSNWGVRTNKAGKFSLQLPAGTYELSTDPNGKGSNRNSSAVYTAGRTTIVVGADGVLEGSADVRLTEPNLQGVVRADTKAVPYSYVQIEKWNATPGYWEWKPGISTRSSGAYAVNLTAGKWRLRASPSGQFARDYAAGELIVVVNDAGQISSESGTPLSGSVDISFQLPNIKVVLTTPGVSYASLGIQFFDTVRNYFQSHSYASISSSSGVAANLQTGRYRLSVNPNNNPEFVETEKFVKVNSDGKICVLANQTSTECAAGSLLSAPAEISIGLNGPNLRGTVTRGEGGVGTGSYIQIERFNASQQNFQWASWAYSNSLGKFSARLAPGWYKLTANPNDAGIGFSRTVSYVVVYEPDSDGDTWCRPAAATSPAPCADTNGALYGVDDNFGFALEPSNIRATVKFGIQSISDGSVNVSTKVNDNFQWFNTWAQISRGEFGMVLPGGPQPVQYRLTINPPYVNTNKLGKKRVTLWVGDFVSGGRTDDVCLELLLSACTESSANVYDSGEVFAIEMTTANIVGEVVDPLLSSTKIQGSNIEVRVWSNSSWQWTDNYVTSDSNGAISVNLEPGTYQLTARAPWNSVNPLTSSKPMQITVQEDGQWCLDSNPTNPVCSQADISSLLSIKLGSPNLVATLKYGTTSIPSSWVNVSKAETNGGSTWWRWIDKSTHSNQNGKIAIDLLDDGRYKIDAFPPYSAVDGIQLVRFSTYFRIKNGEICRGEACDDSSTYATSLNDEVLNFPVPNLIGTVKNTDGTTLRDAWIQVEKWGPDASFDGRWSWIDSYAQSNFAGKFALLLSGEGKYRVKVNPPWNSSTLPRFSKIVNVDADDNVCMGEGCTPASASLVADFEFPLPNVTGQVLLNSGTVPVLSKWSWVGASKGSEYEWSNTNVNGDFAMYLGDGEDWSLWFYPDYSKSNAQPMNVKATISGGVLTSWRYSFQSVATNNCVPGSISACVIDLAFDFVPPNFKVLVSFETVPVAGAFVRMTQVDDSSKVFDFVTNSLGLVTGNIPMEDYDVSVVDAIGADTRIGSSSISVESLTELGVAANVSVSVQVPSG
jgi:hypothetical protein